MPQKRQCDYREAGAARQENIQAVWQPVPDGLKFYDQFRDPSRSTVFPPCSIIQPHAALFVNRNKQHPAGCRPRLPAELNTFPHEVPLIVKSAIGERNFEPERATRSVAQRAAALAAERWVIYKI